MSLLDRVDGVDAELAQQRRVLAQVLLLNALLAGGLLATGIYADSSGLIANALDNASDSVVYAISYFAVGRSARGKTVAASVSGVMLLMLALSVMIDALRRFVVGSDPVSGVMVGMSLAAAGINLWSLRLLAPLHLTDVNVRAAHTFSINDFVSNLGVLVAAVLVAWTGRFWPDVVVGLSIALVVGKGGIEILRDVQRTARDHGGEPA
ncbi:MAG: cation transporter [Vicinamibacterales bacterium]